MDATRKIILNEVVIKEMITKLNFIDPESIVKEEGSREHWR